MKRFLLVALAALGIALSSQAGGFSFRTTGEDSMRIFTVRPTPVSAGVPSLSDANHVKFWVPDAGHVGYSAGNIYISQNGGPWTQLSSFVGSGAVASVFGRTGSIAAMSGDYTATQITNTPFGTISGTTVQSALNELSTEKADGPASSILNEVALYADTSGKLLKRASGTGLTVLTSGVLSTTTSLSLGTYTLSGTTAQFNTALSDNDFATLAGTETFTNKSLNLASNTLTATSAQLATALSDETGSGGGFVRATSPTLSGPIFSTIVNTGTLTLPTSTDTLTGRATTDTLTNKSISGATNTLSAIPNAALTNSAVTIGSTSVSLGATAATVAGLTLTTPTIASFTNAAHNHTNAAGGGQITVAAQSDYAAATVAYNAANFTAQSGSWTVDAGDQSSFAYVRSGNKLTVWFSIFSTDVSATPSYLSITIPGGFSAAFDCRTTFYYQNAGGANAVGLVATTGTQIRLYRDTTTSLLWSTTSSDNTHVQGVAEIYIN